MAKREKLNLLETGIFTVPDVARLVGADQSTVRVWIDGHTGKQTAVIENELGKINGKTAVSFNNLLELRFVAFFARQGVPLREIRLIMGEVRKSLSHPHPFATKTVFKTDGRKIVEQIGRDNGIEDIYDLRSRNYEMQNVVLESLKDDVVYDPFGGAVSWRPRPSLAPNVIVHPRFSFGRPILKDSHIPTKTLANAVAAEGSVKFVADIFDISERRVKEAVTFENNLKQAA